MIKHNQMLINLLSLKFMYSFFVYFDKISLLLIWSSIYSCDQVLQFSAQLVPKPLPVQLRALTPYFCLGF